MVQPGQAARALGRALRRAGARLLAVALSPPPVQRFLADHTSGRYYNFRFTTPDRYAAQGYELLSHTFAPAELEPPDAFQDELSANWAAASESRAIIIGRIHKWAYTRELIRSRGRRLVVPPEEAPAPEDVQMVAVVSGSFIALDRRDAIGALGHMATHALSRRGRGHGTALAQAFEHALLREAGKRRRRLRLVILESRPEARTFWARQGFRCIEGVRYRQPALDFDPATGQPRGEALPENLMVKPMLESAGPGSDHTAEPDDRPGERTIDQALLRRAVFALYKHWYVPDLTACSPRAQARIKAYLFDELFGDFVASLPGAGAPARLYDPSPAAVS
jgi:hypothetical protein